MWIERSIRDDLARLAASFPAVVLTGPRQVGKTSLLRTLLPDVPLLSLDDPALADQAETLPAAFLAAHPPPLALDEVQYAPKLFRHLKAAIDARPHDRGLYFLTGSQNYALMHQVSDSLAGRAAVVPFLGLSGHEWAAGGTRLAAHGWFEFLLRGSFPALWSDAAAPPPERWYQSYVTTYLERDVRNLVAVKNLRDFERFLRATAARTAQSLNVTDLARDVGISPSTAREWLSVLEASGTIVLLEPFHESMGKRLAKAPKLHFTDTGLCAHLQGLATVPALLQSPRAGALFETYVVGQWLRFRAWHRPSMNLWYYRDAAGREVDLLVEVDGVLVPMEVKLAEHPGRDDARHIEHLRAHYGPSRVPVGYVVCTASAPFRLGEAVEARPGWTTWPWAPLA